MFDQTKQFKSCPQCDSDKDILKEVLTHLWGDRLTEPLTVKVTCNECEFTWQEQYKFDNTITGEPK